MNLARPLPSYLVQRYHGWKATTWQENKAWYRRLAMGGQHPRAMVISCCDSRVHVTSIFGADEGEFFIHRNVANLVFHNDFSCLSVLQYAIDVLGIEHVIVCGHYGCGGVTAAYEQRPLGLVDNWLLPIRDTARAYASQLAGLPTDQDRVDRLCELNVLAQARRVCRTTIVQQAWEKGRSLAVHAWVYRLNDGLLRDLGFCATDLVTADADFERTTGTGTGR